MFKLIISLFFLSLTIICYWISNHSCSLKWAYGGLIFSMLTVDMFLTFLY